MPASAVSRHRVLESRPLIAARSSALGYEGGLSRPVVRRWKDSTACDAAIRTKVKTIVEGSGVETDRSFIVTDRKTLMTKVPGIFAGGDMEHGPRTAVEAIRSGTIAAASIDAWLRGATVDAAAGKPARRAEVTPDRRNGRRDPPLPALRRLHRLRPVHGRLQRDGDRGAAHGRHARRPARPGSGGH
jgi:hypothetical protein